VEVHWSSSIKINLEVTGIDLLTENSYFHNNPVTQQNVNTVYTCKIYNVILLTNLLYIIITG
jgi:formate/nitrite transporter FocA (FNT family)